MMSFSSRLQVDRGGGAEELEGLRRRVHELEHTLSAEREQAGRTQRTLCEVLSLVSHEMRSPLGALRLQLDRLARNARKAREARELDLIARCLRSARRLSNLAETIAEYPRLQREDSEIRGETFDLAMLAREVVADVDSSINREGLLFGTTSEEPLRPLRSDPVLVRLVLLHLLLHTISQHETGEVRVAVSADETCHYFTVTGASDPDCGADVQEETNPAVVDLASGVWPPVTRLAFIVARQMLETLGGSFDASCARGATSTVAVSIPSRATSNERVLGG